MSDKCDKMKQIRLDEDNAKALKKAQKKLESRGIKATLGSLANRAIRVGFSTRTI